MALVLVPNAKISPSSWFTWKPAVVRLGGQIIFLRWLQESIGSYSGAQVSCPVGLGIASGFLRGRFCEAAANSIGTNISQQPILKCRLEIRPRTAQGHVTRKPGWCIERFLHFRGSGSKAHLPQHNVLRFKVYMSYSKSVPPFLYLNQAVTTL